MVIAAGGVNRLEAFLDNQQAAARLHEVNPVVREAVEGGPTPVLILPPSQALCPSGTNAVLVRAANSICKKAIPWR